MASTALSLLVLRSVDIEASLAFYRALGLAFVREQHGSGLVHYSCNFGELVLELYPEKASSPQKPSAHSIMLGFNVASIEDTLAELHKLGIKPKSEPKVSECGRWLNLTDPDGHTVQINEVVTAT